MEIKTRREAANLQLHKYYTGKPCQKGHLSLRYTNTGCCVSCIAGYGRAYKAAVQGKVKVLRAVVDARDYDAVMKYIDALRLAREFDSV